MYVCASIGHILNLDSPFGAFDASVCSETLVHILSVVAAWWTCSAQDCPRLLRRFVQIQRVFLRKDCPRFFNILFINLSVRYKSVCSL